MPTSGLQHTSPGNIATEGKTAAAAAKSLQSCLTLCDPIEGSLPGCPLPGILQARTLEWVEHLVSNFKIIAKTNIKAFAAFVFF